MMRSLPTHSSPFAIAGAALAAAIISLLAASLIVAALAPNSARVEQRKSYESDHHMLRLSPIPPGADWSRS